MGHDWRVAIRSVTRRRGLALAIVLTLTLGIGANAAIFSAIDAVLLKPLPYPAADRLVTIYAAKVTRKEATWLLAPVRVEEWNRDNRTFDGIAGSYFENLTDTTGSLPERVVAMRTSPRFFAVLGTSPALGRTPTPEEERFGGPATAVMSDSFWRSRFNADPSVIGRVLQLDRPRTIVGVMPASFRYPQGTTELWVPAQLPAGLMAERTATFYLTIGRLKPGVTLDAAVDDLFAVQARLGEQFPKTDKGWTANVRSLKEETVGGVRRSLWLLFGAVLLVLLAACGNIACLLLADATRREHEMAVRFAIGASRGVVIRQLLFEGLVLATAGSVLGLLVARFGIQALQAAATRLPRATELTLDWRIVAFTLTLAVVTTLLFALVPALRATRKDVTDRLAHAAGHGGRGEIGGQQLLQRALVAAQVTLAIVLLVGAGLLLRSFWRLQQTAPGFDPEHVMTFRVSASWSERAEAVANRQLRTLQRVMTLPGVTSVAMNTFLPTTTDFPPSEFSIAGRDTSEHTYTTFRQVSADYFKTLRIPILQGDTCRDEANINAPRKAVVTRTFADRFFPNETPIGHEVVLGATSRREIVGVVGDVRERGLMRDPEPVAYLCGNLSYWPDPFYLVRTDSKYTLSVSSLREALHEIEPQRSVYGIAPLTDTVSESISNPRINMILLTLFAATALLLAAIGLYGMLAQFVSQRRREIGLRIALGAQPSHVLAQVVRHGIGVIGIGMVSGVIAAFLLARFMATLVFGISPRDPVTFAIVPIVLSLIAAIATIVPARRAVRVDPMRALRDE